MIKPPAHQTRIDKATTKPKPMMVPISKIATVGFPLSMYADVEKVQRMQRQLRNGESLPPVRLTKLDSQEVRDKFGVSDPTKEYFLNGGHHRLAATKLEHKRSVKAVMFDDSGKRLDAHGHGTDPRKRTA